MDELRAAHVHDRNAGNVIENGLPVETTIAKKNTINGVNEVSAVNKVWSGDKRLSLYGYTLETINLLLLPMVQTKCVPIHIFMSIMYFVCDIEYIKMPNLREFKQLFFFLYKYAIFYAILIDLIPYFIIRHQLFYYQRL